MSWFYIPDNQGEWLIGAVRQLLANQRSIMQQLGVIQQEENKIMVDTASITTAVTNLTAQVAAAQGVEQSTLVLVNGLVAQDKALAAQVASLSAGNVTQAQLDDLAATIQAQADATAANAKPLADAVAANPSQPAPAPAPSSPTT
jgi:hypothetical protein